MLRKVVAISACLFLWSVTLSSQTNSMTRDFKVPADSLKARIERRTGINAPLSLTRVVKSGNSDLDFYFSQELAEYPWRIGDIAWLRKELRDLFPKAYNDNTLGELYFGKQKNLITADIEMPALSNTGKPFYKNLRVANRKVTPLVRSEENWERGLSGRHIAIWQSHGRYYEIKTDRWEWQRAALHRTVEDLYTQSYVLPFLIPMLENAGACVMTPRERDTQSFEVVCDNDPAFAGERGERVRKRGSYRETGIWADAGVGFGDVKEKYEGCESPFRMGSARMVKATDSGRESMAIWVPDIPKRGMYAVYVSYKTMANSISDASYTVRHLGGETTLKVNQKMGGGTWVYLGTFDFGKGRDGCVILSNKSKEEGVVSADAVRFGGGMGRYLRGGRTSGLPAYTEGALYNMLWSGLDSTKLDAWETDYTRDYAGRGVWVNWISGGSKVNPSRSGLKIPVDLSFAFHTDAGVTPNDSIVGTLAIYTLKCDGKEELPSGESRLNCRALTDMVQTQIVEDIRALHNPEWTRRGTWDRSYSESRTTSVPAVLLELLAHQNFADMKYGLDPAFRFDVSRAAYKGILKYLSNRYGCAYTVQPLPVHAFSARLRGGEAQLSWEPTSDPLEPTAKAEAYILQTRVDDGAFNQGSIIEGTSTSVPIRKGHVYSFRIIAFNKGGKSMPSEILSVGTPAGNPKKALIVNNFTRISAPAWFDTPSYAGFVDRIDSGVPYIEDILFTGEVNQFDRSAEWTDDDNPGFGGSYVEQAGRKIGGNTFDYPAVHGRALLKAGYSFSSMSLESFLKATDTEEDVLDLICGKQVTVPGRGFSVFPQELQDALRRYAAKNGNILISGAYIATDAWDRVYPIDPGDRSATQNFIQDILGYKWLTNFGDSSGRINGSGMKLTTSLRYNRSWREEFYRVENPDGIQPASDKAKIIFRYSGTDIPAGTAFEQDKRRVIALGFPIESVMNEDGRDELVKKCADFLTKTEK